MWGLRRNGEKYAVFAGFRQRKGGFEDLLGYFNTVEEAKAYFYKGAWHGGATGPYAGGTPGSTVYHLADGGVPFAWVQIIDLDTGEFEWSREFRENYQDQKRKVVCRVFS